MPLHIAFFVQYFEPKGFEEDDPEELFSSLSSPLELEEEVDSPVPNRDDCVAGGCEVAGVGEGIGVGLLTVFFGAGLRRAAFLGAAFLGAAFLDAAFFADFFTAFLGAFFAFFAAFFAPFFAAFLADFLADFLPAFFADFFAAFFAFFAIANFFCLRFNPFGVLLPDELKFLSPNLTNCCVYYAL